MKRVANWLRDRLDLVRRQPVRVVTGVLIVVVAIFPGVLDEETISEIGAKAIAILGAGELLREIVFSPETVARMTRGARG